MKKIIVFALALIFAAEFFCRVFTFCIHKDIKAFGLNSNLYQPDAFVGFKPVFGFQLKHNSGGYSPETDSFTAPFELKVNRYGFRGPEFNAKKSENTQRIFCLGGSETWGYGVSENQTWIFHLQNYLNSKNYEIINAGVPGYTTFHSLTNLATRILDYEPDMIIISHSWNDIKYFWTVSPENQYGSMISASDYNPKTFFEKWINRSYLYVYLKTALKMLKQKKHHSGKQTAFEGSALPKQSVNYEYGLRVFERNLRTMIAIAKTHHLKVLLVDPLTLVKEDNSNEEKSKIGNGLTHLSFEELIRVNGKIETIHKKLAAEYGVRYVNLNEHIPASLETMIDHIHPTPLGHQKIAEVLAREIPVEAGMPA